MGSSKGRVQLEADVVRDGAGEVVDDVERKTDS